ncbi:DEAD-box ATP-dependent RNA helicase 47, mitochondrial [Olea europaea subsp. europaea]|uniref:RNA helicase n=1 Tax=Olea europaea subsp. europaea TaxID=158383 RepID=A0A8S0U4Z9_OLEEU|nr:DEAD-box ATP-dependent RNA helicase 47, mitochondrial [Olea europaea subsp. europaea]
MKFQQMFRLQPFPQFLRNMMLLFSPIQGQGMAYLLPILSEVGPLKKDVEFRDNMNIEAVIVAPSRELGMQIVREVEKLLHLGPADKRLVQQLVGGANRHKFTDSSSMSLPPSLKQYYSVTKIQNKVDMLRRCVHVVDTKCVIAFMNHSKQLKDAVFKLEAYGMKAAELHGDQSKLSRLTILKKFRNGEVRVLLTNLKGKCIRPKIEALVLLSGKTQKDFTNWREEGRFGNAIAFSFLMTTRIVIVSAGRCRIESLIHGGIVFSPIM